ncbi:Hsp20/alpha crystallin family protein [Candidatus Bathyarchaeota archaeon]|nr:MAG: Hsp20/alpha crystallin family protein [Candidatus Bathyarchaeota archaeon]
MLWDDEESDAIEEVEREINSILEEAYSSSISWLFDLERNSLKPLYRIEVGKRQLSILIDLPGVEKQNVSVKVGEDVLSIDARMKRPVTVLVGGTLQKELEFERYWRSITLPVKVDPDKARARIRNGVLKISIPLAQQARDD